MHAGAEGHSRIHHDAESSGRRGIVAPFRHEEKASAHLHRLQQITRGLHPIAILLDSQGRAREELQKLVAIFGVLKEGTNARVTQFHDACGMVIPEVRDQQFAVVGIALDFQREHVRYHSGESLFIQ